MGIKTIRFSEINNNDSLRKEIASFFTQKNLSLITEQVVKKRWSYAQMEQDEKYIYDKDAENLSSALKRIGCSYVYGTHVDHIYDNQDFDVISFSADVETIELSQQFDYLLDHDASFIFSDYPLKFLIMRPVILDYSFLYVLGEADFIREVSKNRCWTAEYFEGD